MERNWITFDGSPRNRKGRINMSLNQRFELVVNRLGYETLGKPEAVYLLYDPSTDAIAIQPADARMENAFSLTRKNSGGNYCVYIKPLCDRHQIRYDCTVRFLDVTVEDDKLAVNLLKTREVPKRKRPESVKRK